MADETRLDSILLTYIQQQAASMSAISLNTAAVREAIAKTTETIEENTKVTLEIKNGQIQYQKQSLRICLIIIAVEALIIAGLLGTLNIKGHEAITKAVEKALP